MNKPTIYTDGHSASFESGKHEAYYGDREIDPQTEEWCFVLVQKRPNGLEKELARYTNSQLLEVSCGDGPKDMLIAGLALWFGK